MGSPRFGKQQEFAVQQDIERNIYNRADELLDNCRVIIRNPSNLVVDVKRVDQINNRLRRYKTFVMASPLPVGSYDVVEYGPDFVILFNEKRKKYYLNEFKDWLAVRCLEERCYGRGHKKRPVARNHRQEKANLVSKAEDVRPHVPYIVEPCVCNKGLVDELKPQYPDIDSKSIEMKEALENLEIKEINIKDGDAWVLKKLRKAREKKEVENATEAG